MGITLLTGAMGFTEGGDMTVLANNSSAANVASLGTSIVALATVGMGTKP